MRYRVLIVEDDSGIAGAIQTALKSWDIDAEPVRDMRYVTDEFKAYDPSLVLLDIGLPFMDGYHWCAEIRKISSVPIIFISSASDNMNIVMAMNLGGDDFIAKPFDKSVLIAKIQALLRRAYGYTNQSSLLTYAGMTLDTGDCSFTYEGTRTELSKNEYKILLTLLENRGKIVSREKLMEALWKTDCFVDENTLTVNVGRLRKKLEGAGFPVPITTRFGIGYMLEDVK